jgi:hypothetical protein
LCSHYVRKKNILASKQQSTNSLEKKFVQRLNALKKILQRHETEKKICAAKILYPPPGISNGPPRLRNVVRSIF